jgi:hypothetical protein
MGGLASSRVRHGRYQKAYSNDIIIISLCREKAERQPSQFLFWGGFGSSTRNTGNVRAQFPGAARSPNMRNVGPQTIKPSFRPGIRPSRLDIAGNIDGRDIFGLIIEKLVNYDLVEVGGI